MVYRGQTIHQFDASRDDEFFNAQAEQLINFSRFLMVFLIIGAVIAMISQFNTLSTDDIIIFSGFILFIVVLYRALTGRIAKLRDPELLEMEEHLIIYEHGIEFPPLVNTSVDATDASYTETEHEYIPYNHIISIGIEEEHIEVETEETIFIIDLVYFPFYSSEDDNYETQVNFLRTLFQKISTNLSRVENRDHPTIIPKAYFRDILDEYT